MDFCFGPSKWSAHKILQVPTSAKSEIGIRASDLVLSPNLRTCEDDPRRRDERDSCSIAVFYLFNFPLNSAAFERDCVAY
ncbi:hypothetical protein SDJN03_13190, partial [Cucurbita argyrosperma subsp. sororia]